MHALRLLLSLAAIACLCAHAPGQIAQPNAWRPAPELTPPEAPREFRAVWIASVANIDWPSAKGLPRETQLEEMTRILDAASRCNLNAVILQVRPACDALYPSQFEPWSEFLTGQSGEPPTPAYDPLATWIQEAHARGLELHAWFNPFRARHFKSEKPDAPSHVSRAHPDWVRSYDNFLWLDPGVAPAREHSLRVILDVVARYDIDGVHLDDYFYPYPKGAAPFPDDQPFGAYRDAGGTLARPDWRRENINTFVRDLYAKVKSAKPHVKVGISPFGIWRPGSPPGIEGFDAFEKLSADARLWLRNGWLDYCSPQLYWATDSTKQSYARLLDWWIANNDQQRHIWVGNYTSRIEPADAPPNTPSWSPDEILRQIELTRATAKGPGGGSGNIHFSAISLVQNRRAITDALRAGPYAQPALVPASPWLAGTSPSPGAPELSAAPPANEQVQLTLKPGPGEPPTRWLIWGRYGDTWKMAVVAATSPVPLRTSTGAGELNAVAALSLDRFGRQSLPTTISRP